MSDNNISFELLANSIRDINIKAGTMAKSAVNQLMTLRNWAIGYYIVEYEQDGNDRADYGNHSTVSNEFVTNPEMLVKSLSFSHIREIMVIEDAFERFFYETECIKCNWSVRELRRQIKTNLYIRVGISKKPELLIQPTVDNNSSTALTIKDPYRDYAFSY